ncbi:GAF domain-containing protein [Umezawaea sp.]|uniref:GAF domain-containing protein n=1 Tax=Umezawaea sp. TaxID=1955258 RepID=UPI002ED35998
MNSDEPDVAASHADTGPAANGVWRSALGALLSGASPLSDPLALTRSLVECARVHGGATTAALTVPFHDGDWVRVVVATGDLSGWENSVLPLGGSVTALAVEAARTLLIDEVTLDERTCQSARSSTVGPCVVAPAYSGGEFQAALLLTRSPGRAGFGEADREMATAFAEHLAWALLVPNSQVVRCATPADSARDVVARVYGDIAGSLFAITSTLCSLKSHVPDAFSKRIDSAVLEADRITSRARVVASEQARTGRDRSFDTVLSVFGAAVAEHGLVGTVAFDSSASPSSATVDAVARWVPDAVSTAATFGITRAVALDLAARTVEGAEVLATVRYRGWPPEEDTSTGADAEVNSWFDAGSTGETRGMNDRDVVLRLLAPDSDGGG